MASPNPIPCGFVVTNASNILSNFSESIPGPESLHRHDNCFAAIALSSNSQHPSPIGYRVHCIDRVAEQVKHDFLQLDAMAGDKRQVGCQFGMGYDTMILQFSAKDVQCSKSNPVQIDRAALRDRSF